MPRMGFWSAVLMTAAILAQPAFAMRYATLRATEVEQSPLGSKHAIDGLILLSGGGYWFVIRSPRCDDRGTVRVLSGIRPRIRAEVYKAVGQTNDHRLFVVRADIFATMTPGTGPDAGRRGLSIISVKNVRLVRLDCLQRDPLLR